MIGRSAWARAGLALVVAVAVGGCGSRVDRGRLAAALGDLSLSSSASSPAAAGTDTGPAATDGGLAAATGATDPSGQALPAGLTPGALTGGRRATPAAADPTLARLPGKGTPGVASATPTGAGAPAGAGPATATGGAPGSAAVPTPGTPGRPGAVAAKAPILFGTMGTGSGVIGRATQPIITANKAWSADVNARGGLAGHPVKLIFGDDGGDPAAALAIAKRMVEQDKVVAFIGTYLVTTTPAVTPYLEQVGVP
ncbi:MAG TPA: ABC transporter substrate-binding protein, partial [Acidimicrobiia bacterium]|nr:ABC transporter substrate-binding protein [Acidimicrobiia bacterium]